MRWALFGASDIAASRLVPAMRSQGDEITALVSGSGAHAVAFAERFGIARVYDDPQRAVESPDVDAVYISSRNDKHVEQAILAAGAGKHILCEKPVALSVDSARLLIKAVAEAGVTCAVNHHLPAAATHAKIRELVHQGAIGTPLAVSVAHAVALPERLQGWRLGGDPGSGVVADITCHDASVINALLGRQADFASAVGVHQGPWVSAEADAVVTGLSYGQVAVQTHDAFTVAFRPTRFDVFGTEGAVLGADVMTQEPAGTVVLRTSSGEHVVDVGERRDLYSLVLDAFRGAISGVGRPTVTLEEGINAFIVAEAVNQSLATGRRVPIDTWFSSAASHSSTGVGLHA